VHGAELSCEGGGQEGDCKGAGLPTIAAPAHHLLVACLQGAACRDCQHVSTRGQHRGQPTGRVVQVQGSRGVGWAGVGAKARSLEPAYPILPVCMLKPRFCLPGSHRTSVAPSQLTASRAASACPSLSAPPDYPAPRLCSYRASKAAINQVGGCSAGSCGALVGLSNRAECDSLPHFSTHPAPARLPATLSSLASTLAGPPTLPCLLPNCRFLPRALACPS